MAAEFINDSNPDSKVFGVKKMLEVLPRKRRCLKMSFEGFSQKPGVLDCSMQESTKITGLTDENNPENTICLPGLR